MYRLTILATAWLALAGFGTGATVFVPDNYAVIQDAIVGVAAGDTIIVRPGTYGENIDFMGKAITLVSELGAAVTVIDGKRTGSVVSFSRGEGASSILEGFTLTNGSGTGNPGDRCGGGILCDLKACPVVRNNVIVDNVADFGGGVYCRDFSSPDIIDNRITGNHADRNGGGIGCRNGSEPLISGNAVSGNMAYGRGGGIYCFDSSPKVAGNRIVENVAIMGGGLYCEHSSCPVITHNSIDGNSAICGGGLCCWSSSNPDVRKNTINRNGAETGGGIHCHESSPIITENTLSENRAHLQGGGIFCADSSCPVVQKNSIKGNMAASEGGGIFCDESSPTVTRNGLVGNRAGGDGGGMNFRGVSSPLVVNNFVTRCLAGYKGGGICAHTLSSPIVRNCTLAGNLAAKGGGGLACRYQCDMDVVNTILWGNNSPEGPEILVGGDPYHTYTTTITINHSVVKGGLQSCYVHPFSTLSWGAGMIESDPLFVAPADGDLHLTWKSPCRNTGDNASVAETSDFEGDPRIVQGTVDMGADEFGHHLYRSGAVLPGASVAVKVVGIPGFRTTLVLGYGVQDPPKTTPHGDLWLKMPAAKIWQLGPIPGTGVLTRAMTVPAGWSSGSDHPFQALVGPWGGSRTRLTNLMVLTVK